MDKTIGFLFDTGSFTSNDNIQKPNMPPTAFDRTSYASVPVTSGGKLVGLHGKLTVSTSGLKISALRSATALQKYKEIQKTDFSLTEANLKALSVYYDDGGYPHSLPRYYKSKILDLHIPNVLSHAVQNYIYAHIDMLHNKALARFAYSMGYRNVNEKAPDLGLPYSEYNFLSDQYNAYTRLQADACVERCQIKLNNFYKRPLSHPIDRVRALIT